MLKRVLTLISVYLYYILIFWAGKIFFICYHYDLFKDSSFGDKIDILINGLPLDLATAGYFTILPGIFLILSGWLKNKVTSVCLTTYFAVIAAFISIILIADAALFSFWGFHLDTNALFYLKNPSEAFASVSGKFIVAGVAGIVMCFALIMLGYKVLIDKQIKRLGVAKPAWKSAIVLFVMTGALIIPIRGGFSVSTMNIGKVYFSTNAHYNQAAINPCFNFLYSLSKTDDYSSQYQFMDNEEAERIVATMTDRPVEGDIPDLLNTSRPNIILFVLESFGAVITEPLGGIKDVAPNLTKFCEEGILFENFYANSFRTDRGLINILSGYPAQATVSIMKYPQKTQTLPAIPKTLGKNGYSRELFYGGDIDFTNMRSYFFGCCEMENIISDKDFPLNERMTKWGAPDHVVIDAFSERMKDPDLKQPFFKMVLTLSSHEPFEVPFKKFEDPYLNSIAYTDSCLGDFVEKFKKTPYKDNTLIILVPDHAPAYPNLIEIFNPERYKIPMIWLGGAVKQPATVKEFGSQIDLAATLFAQMKIDHDDFTYSKNILNPVNPHFAYYSFVDGFAVIDSSNTVIFDNSAEKAIVREGNETDSLLTNGKAYLQYLYRDLGKR